MAFHEVQFPPAIAYGSSGGPGFETMIVSVDSGQEERIARRGQARCTFDVASGLKAQEDVATLVTFFRARQGCAFGFRFKDWSDYATTVAGVTYGSPGGALLDATTHTDSVIGIGDGITTTFQLIKQYTNGGVTRNRTITKPVSGTVKIGLNGVNQTTGWSVNTATGVITFTTAPSAGVSVSAGFEFDVPVRFGDDVDKLLPVSLEEYRQGTVQVPLIELLDEGVSSDEFYYGGGTEIASGADITIDGSSRVWAVHMTTGSKKVHLPSTASTTPGAPIFYVINDGGLSFDIVDASGTTVVSAVGDGTCVELFMTINSLGEKVWYAK